MLGRRPSALSALGGGCRSVPPCGEFLEAEALDFSSLCTYLKRLGFIEEIEGSHHQYAMGGVPEIINLQPRSDGKAKPYQVKQVREWLRNNGM